MQFLRSAGKVIDVCQHGFRAEGRRWLWRVIAAALCLAALLSSAFDLYRAKGLEKAAQGLNHASVLGYEQRRAESSIVDMLKARLQGVNVITQPTEGQVFATLQKISDAAVGDGLAHVDSVELQQGQWRLEVRARAFGDIDELQRRWQGLGFKVLVETARKDEQGISVQIALKERVK